MYTTKNQRAASRPEVTKARLKGIAGKIIKTLVIIGAVLGTLYGICKAGEKFLMSDDFMIKSVVVKGNYSVSKEAIVRAGGLYANMNIYFLETERIKQGILRHPDIEKAEIEREIPTNLIIRVKERETVVLLKTPKGRTLPMDRYGHILSDNKLENTAGLPIVMTDNEIGLPGHKCQDKKVLSAISYLMVIRHAPERNFLKIKTVDTRQKDALVFKTASIEEILFSEEYSSDEVAKIFEVVKNLRETGRVAAKIDARYEDVAVVCKYL